MRTLKFHYFRHWSVLEPNDLDKGDFNLRPDGMTQFTWREGKCLVWDATCVDTLCDSHVISCRTTAGAGAEYVEKFKDRKYESLQGRYFFVAVGVETLGSWGPSAKYLISDIGRRIAERTGEKRSTEFLMQRIGIEIQRGNAASVRGTVDNPKTFDDSLFLLAMKNDR